MNFDEYQTACAQFAIYPKDREREYLSLGLLSEVGELAGKVAKEIRDDVDLTTDILKEAGDVMWFAAMLCSSHYLNLSAVAHFDGWNTGGFMPSSKLIYHLAYQSQDAVWDGGIVVSKLSDAIFTLKRILMNHNTTLESVCEQNIAKLTDRKNRDKLGGSGDAR